MNLVKIALVAASLATGGVALAKDAKKEPNCEVKAKKKHVKDEAACTKEHGKWLAAPAATAPAAAGTETAPAPDAAAPAAAPTK